MAVLLVKSVTFSYYGIRSCGGLNIGTREHCFAKCVLAGITIKSGYMEERMSSDMNIWGNLWQFKHYLWLVMEIRRHLMTASLLNI